MDAVSLAIGVVGLYNACMDVITRVRDYKEFGKESSTTIVRFDASKIRLQNWAKTLGIHDGKLVDPHDFRLDDPQTASVIQNILYWISKVFERVDHRSESLKLPVRRRSAGVDGWALPLDKVTNVVEQPRNVSTRSRIAWAMGGKDKLSKDIQHFEGLVNILYDVVAPRDFQAGSVTDLPFGRKTVPSCKFRCRSRSAVDVWLDAIKDDDQFGKMVNSRQDGTCSWILSHPAYITWESQESEEDVTKLLWIYGPAGFGKTILSAWLACLVRETLGLPLAYCFSSSHAQRSDGLDSIARTWITQLVRKDKSVLDLAHQARQKQNTRRAMREDIWNLMRDIATQIQTCVLVLDGLDEFQNVDDRRREFLRDLKNALQSTGVRVLITSRNELDIEAELRSSAMEPQKYTILECKLSEDSVKKDIDLVSSSIVVRKLPGQEDSLRRELATKMADRCNGQFLWLKLQQDQLRDSKSPKALQKIVQAMPQGLHSTYGRSWNVIQSLEESDRDRAVDTLRWLTFAYGPMMVQELAEALVVNVDSNMEAFSEDDLPKSIDDGYIDGEIRNLCGSLVELRDESKRPGPKLRRVHLVHASVNEFLVAKLPTSPLLRFVSGRPQQSAAQHVKLAACCIRFLDCPKAWDPSEGEDCHLFITYAANAWFRHLRDSEGFYDNICDLVNNFMTPGNANFEKWKKRYESGHKFPIKTSATALYYASLFGLLPAMDFLHDNKHLDINSVGGQYGTPLQAVCAKGYTEAFECLLLWKPDVAIRGGQFDNALNAAAYYGRISMAKALLEVGASAYSPGITVHEAVRMVAGRGTWKL